MDNLLFAHDRIATKTDRTPSLIASSQMKDSNNSDTAYPSTNKTLNQNANIVNNNVLKVIRHFPIFH